FLGSTQAGETGYTESGESPHTMRKLRPPKRRLMKREQLPAEPVTSDDLAALRALVEGTARGTGEDFFHDLVRHLAFALDVRHAFVAEFTSVRTRVRTLAYWSDGRIEDNVEYVLAGTPCEDVVRGQFCHHPSGVKEKFPGDRPLVEMGVESYLGV